MPYYHKKCIQNLGRKTKRYTLACNIMSLAKCLNNDGKYAKDKRCVKLARYVAKTIHQ